MSFNVWAESRTIRYKRDQAASSGLSVFMGAARRETRGFQILLRHTSSVNNIDIVASALTGPAGTIPATNVWTYRAHQLEVIQETFNTVTPNDGVGWYPCQLIPTRHPVTGAALPAATYVAFPYDLPANQTHTLWVEVRVPYATAPGTYEGTVTVSGDGQPDTVVGISLKVHDFSLPLTTELRNHWGSGPGLRMYRNLGTVGLTRTDEELVAMYTAVNTVCSNHRIAAMDLGSNSYMTLEGSELDWEMSAAEVTRLQNHIDAYNTTALWVIHGQWLVDAPLASPEIEYYQAWMDAMDAGIAAIDRPDVMFITHTDDEPASPEDSDFVALWGPVIKASPNVKSLVQHPMFQVGTEDVDDLKSGTEIWAFQMKLYSAGAINDVLAVEEEAWLYSALADSGNPAKMPHWHLDFPMMHFRVTPWMIYAGHMTGWTLWGSGIYAWSTYNSGTTPWTEPATIARTPGAGTIFVQDESPSVVGDGTSFLSHVNQYMAFDDADDRHLLYRVASIESDTELTLERNYSGTTGYGLTWYRNIFNQDGLLVPPAYAEEIGYNGIIETLSLKSLAAGAADYDLMTLAVSYGFAAEVNALIDNLVTPISVWSTTYADYDTAMETLRELIATVRVSLTLTPLFQRDYEINGHMGFRLRIVASDGVRIDNNVFRHHQKPLNAAGASTSTFSGVCSYPDMEELPIDVSESNTSPAAFRTDTMDIVVDSVSIAKDIWTLTKTQVDELIATTVALGIMSLGVPHDAVAE